MIGRRDALKGLVIVTFPGLGGQQAPPQNSSPAGQLVPGVQPGVSGQIVARRVVIIGTGGLVLVYSPSAAAGNLIDSIAGAAGTDQFGNHFLAGLSSYAATFATSVQSGFVAFFAGSLAGGWAAVSEVAGDASGNLQVNSGGQLQLIASTTVSVQGGTSVGPADNSGVTSGPSGTVSAFPAAGPNHTHAMAHHHPYHP